MQRFVCVNYALENVWVLWIKHDFDIFNSSTKNYIFLIYTWKAPTEKYKFRYKRTANSNLNKNKKRVQNLTYTHLSTCIYRLSSSIPFPYNIILLYIQGIIITFDNQNQVVIKWRDLDAVALWHVAVILLEFDVERPTSWVRDLYLKLLSHLNFLVLDVLLEFRWIWRKGKWMIKRENLLGIPWN